ncbi:carbohydrate kinase family protein [Paenibacillus sp. MBLB4367]|uniref:carbohydrate kinase family protein n=1 Tax=Paenibacillus sp. MBLB4367 TaxID=3384767 RepID=UPI003907F09B
MMYDVVALGEYLIDFLPAGRSEAGQPLFERNPGGAPVNVLAALAKLEKKTAFIGKVGKDPFGEYLRDVLLEQGIDASGLVFAPRAHTTMAFVQLDEQGERSFHFCRQPGADQELSGEEIDKRLLEKTAIFHFGSISMTADPSYTATLQAVRHAKASGAVISYDPNLRPALWEDEAHARRTIEEGFLYADLVKISQEELLFLSGTGDLEAGSKQLAERFPALKLLLVTLGSEGTFYYRGTGASGHVPAFEVRTVDTTGAGDGFFGAFLYRAAESGKALEAWEKPELEEAVAFANAAGALATTRKGAIPSMATKEEITRLMEGI